MQSKMIKSLPENTILNVLTRLPGKDVARCKCVSRQWNGLIRSPPFLSLYRRRNKCLIVHWSEGDRLHFRYSLLRRQQTQFQPLRPLGFGRYIEPVTQLVNGVICSISGRESTLTLEVNNVFTGQSRPVTPPLPRNGNTAWSSVKGNITWSSFSLGYDPRSRRYKVLRVIFPVEVFDNPDPDHTIPDVEAEVITLGATEEWRRLDNDGAGISRLVSRIGVGALQDGMTGGGVLMSPADGFSCWICKDAGIMVFFDVKCEDFRWVELPAGPGFDVEDVMVVPRVRLNNNRLAVYLWALDQRFDEDEVDYDNYLHVYEPECGCFVLDDEEGRAWRKLLRPVVPGERFWLGAANGSLFSSSESSITLVSCNNLRRDAYCTDGEGTRRFYVGLLPEAVNSYHHNTLTYFDAWNGFEGKFTCLVDSNVLHLPLEDVLNGHGLV